MMYGTILSKPNTDFCPYTFHDLILFIGPIQSPVWFVFLLFLSGRISEKNCVSPLFVFSGIWESRQMAHTCANSLLLHHIMVVYPLTELDSICVRFRDKEAERSAKPDVKQDNSSSKCQSNKRKLFSQLENVAEGSKKRKWVSWLKVKTGEKII